MSRNWLAAASFLAAVGIPAAVYFAAPYAGLHVELSLIATMAAVLAAGFSVAALTVLMADRSRFGGGRATLLLNEDPAKEYVFPFRGENVAQIVARADMPLAMVLARFGDTFRRPAAEMTKDITVTLRGSKKMPFPTITLQQLFLTLKLFKLEHVLLFSDKDEFIGYIPGKRAAKEFTGDNAAEKITKYVVNVIDKPDNAGVLREIGGAAEADTVKASDDIRYAERQLWSNESVNGLIVLKKGKPAGYISKVDVLRLNAGRP